MQACVRLDDGECSDKFDVGQGLRQGCVLAPLLFGMFFTAVLRVAEKCFLADAAITDDMVQLQRNNERGEKRGTSRTGKADGRRGKEEDGVQRLWGSSGNCELTLATVAIDDPHAAGGRGYRPLGDSPSPSLSGKQSRISRPNPAQISPEIEMERIRSEVAQDENRPMNRPYYQQTLRAWSLLLTPWRAVGGYLLIGLIFVPLGAFLWSDADSIVDMRLQYDGTNTISPDCMISEYKQGKTCEISFDVGEDISGPVYVYYELSNFYQNHATYVESVDQDQLLGSTSTSSVDDNCTPLVYNGSAVLHPCGLIANTLFNDIFTVTSNHVMDETDIAWDSDVADKFVQPDGFVSALCDDSNVTCAACLDNKGLTDSDGDTVFSGCGTIVEDGETYAYYYPDEDTTQYLYETFPEVISPLVGVKDEHFIVWMRTSGLSRFRKLYGRIDAGLQQGDQLNFNVTANFIVDYFNGTKSIVISNTGDLGGQMSYWAESMTTVGIIVLCLALILAVKHKVSKRVMGDITKLLD
eukprot:jgi/Undpi1/1188/HiC_scaffold_10.g04650.m1